MQLIEVSSAALAREFLMFPVRLYKSNKNYIRPLDSDIDQVFDSSKNKLFRDGKCYRWLLIDESGATIGRIAAFIGPSFSKGQDQPTGGIGFFECINDKSAAFMLFDQAINWLKNEGMEAMDGPINFGDRDKFWGLLVDNFSAPVYGAAYNFPYYRELFEAYGFKDYYQQYTFYRTVDEKLVPEYYDKAERILNDSRYTFEHLRLKKLSKYTEDFRVVYNKGWARHQGVKEMSIEQAKRVMQKLKPVIDERIIWFAYYDGEPIGFFIALPELNQLFKYVNGKLDWIGKLKFLFHKWRGACTTMYGVAFGIVPEHQGKAVETAMVVAASRVVQSKRLVHYQDFIMNWVGDFNPKMITVIEKVGGRLYKTHITYRYIFDREKPFNRAKVL